MWLDDQSHREDWRSHRFHQGGPTNLRTVNPEFGIDATREELSILTVLPNPIASGLGVLHRPTIDPQDFSRPPAPDPAAPAPGLRHSRGRLGTVPPHWQLFAPELSLLTVHAARSGGLVLRFQDRTWQMEGK